LGKLARNFFFDAHSTFSEAGEQPFFDAHSTFWKPARNFFLTRTQLFGSWRATFFGAHSTFRKLALNFSEAGTQLFGSRRATFFFGARTTFLDMLSNEGIDNTIPL
jgi:hypothetical protein